MKILLTILYSIVHLNLFSQILTRRVADKSTGLPISFATIKVLNKPSGTIASQNGEFNLNIQKEDSILISSVGYEKKIITGKDVEVTIFLDRKERILSEVIIKNKKPVNTILLGNGKDRIHENLKCHIYAGEIISACYPWGPAGKTEFAEKIELPDSNFTYRIKKIYIPVSKGRCWGPLLIHVYQKDSLGKYPGEEIFLKLINVNNIMVKKDWVVIDVTQEKINFQNSSCFFISAGWTDDDETNCLTRISILRSDKGESFARSLGFSSYSWFSFGHMKDRFGYLFEERTNYAVEVDEMK